MASARRAALSLVAAVRGAWAPRVSFTRCLPHSIAEAKAALARMTLRQSGGFSPQSSPHSPLLNVAPLNSRAGPCETLKWNGISCARARSSLRR
jgi:hypothetical protein